MVSKDSMNFFTVLFWLAQFDTFGYSGKGCNIYSYTNGRIEEMDILIPSFNVQLDKLTSLLQTGVPCWKFPPPTCN